MPRGGARPGAGRKPKARPATVLGMDGRRFPLLPADAVPVRDEAVMALADPPADLPPAQQAIWTQYAPAAIEQRTLVPATVMGFRQLCEQTAMAAVLAARIEKVGAASKRAGDPLRHYVRLAQRLDASLARFKLTSFGKPADGKASTQPAANPWVQVGRR